MLNRSFSYFLGCFAGSLVFFGAASCMGDHVTETDELPGLASPLVGLASFAPTRARNIVSTLSEDLQRLSEALEYDLDQLRDCSVQLAGGALSYSEFTSRLAGTRVIVRSVSEAAQFASDTVAEWESHVRGALNRADTALLRAGKGVPNIGGASPFANPSIPEAIQFVAERLAALSAHQRIGMTEKQVTKVLTSTIASVRDLAELKARSLLPP